MLNSSVLDIAIGVVFVFLLLSIFATAINEVILSLLSKRGQFLLKGIETLLSDISTKEATGTGLVGKIYNHGQVYGLFEGPFDPKKFGNLPSYIPARNFAIALLDSIAQPFSEMPPATPNSPDPAQGAAAVPQAVAPAVMQITEDFKKAVEALAANEATKKIGVPLQSMITMAGKDATKLQKSVEDWFNSGMDRVSGRYKYYTQNWLFGIGLAIAISMNADTIHIVRQLSNDSTLRQSLVAEAKAYTPPASLSSQTTTSPTDGAPPVNPDSATPPSAGTAPSSPAAAPPNTAPAGQGASDKPATPQEQITKASKAFDDVKSLGLPLGWSAEYLPHNFPEYLNMILGWFITAFAISLGAPFWFDTLNKVMVIRSTIKPTEKSQDEGSKDKQKTQ